MTYPTNVYLYRWTKIFIRVYCVFSVDIILKRICVEYTGNLSPADEMWKRTKGLFCSECK